MSMNPSRARLDSMTLADMAVDNRIYVVRCNYCRKGDNYLARDLADLYGATRSAWGIFHTCRHCGRSEWLRVQHRLPTYDDVGHLRVRRPAGVRTIQLWEDGWFG